MNDLEKAVLEALKCYRAYDEACLSVWRHIESIDPQATAALEATGLEKSYLAQWIVVGKRESGASALDLVASGRVKEAAEAAMRMTCGFVG